MKYRARQFVSYSQEIVILNIFLRKVQTTVRVLVAFVNQFKPSDYRRKYKLYF